MKKKKNSHSRINTGFIKLFYYLMRNYALQYKSIFSEIDYEILDSYNRYIKKSNLEYYALEIGGIVLYLSFFITICIYFYNSNMIIIKNIIFLFIDLNEDNYSIKNSKNGNLIKLKLLKFKDLIQDFDLNRLNNYFESINNLNKNKYIIDDQLTFNEQKNNFNKNYENKKDIKEEKAYNNEKSLFKKQSKVNRNFKNDSQKLKSNNSSYNYLVGSESKLFKNNPKFNSFGSNASLINVQQINNNESNSMNEIQNINNSKNNESEIKKNYYEAILNNSNKTIMSITQKYLLIMTLFIISIISISFYKIVNNIDYFEQSNKYHQDFSVITNRYSMAYKSLFIMSQNDKGWIYIFNMLKNMNIYFSKSNTQYNEVLNHKMSSYKEVAKLLEILQYNKEDSPEYIKNIFCFNNTACQEYLKSSDSMINLGIDFALKNCFSYINNIYLDYQQLKNKTDINEIVETITGPQFFEFRKLRKCYLYIFYNVHELIYSSFEKDQYDFRKKTKKNIYYLNIGCAVLSILIVLFAFESVFIINNYIEPIKKSVYRLQHSFYYINSYYNK